jgi:hypothetical protein
LGLPRSQCGPFAARIAKKGEPHPGGVSKAFINAMDYLKSDSGPTLTTADALNMAEDLVQHGQAGFDNFKQAYTYGVSSKGMNLSRVDSIQFAKKLAKTEAKAEVPAKK